MPQTTTQSTVKECLPFDPGLAHAVVKAHVSGLAELSHCMLDQTLETMSWPIAFGRTVAGSRTISQLLDQQMQLNQQTWQALLERGRRLSEVSATLTRDISDCIQEGANQTADTVQQQTSAAAEQMAEHARNAAGTAAKTAESAQSHAQQESRPGQSPGQSQTQRTPERRPQQGPQATAAH